jgi:hypothetical protein
MNKWTEEEKKLIEYWLPKPPNDATPAEKRLFEEAVKNITIKRNQKGLIEFSYEALTETESFALGLTATKEWPFFRPKEIKKGEEGIRRKDALVTEFGQQNALRLIEAKQGRSKGARKARDSSEKSADELTKKILARDKSLGSTLLTRGQKNQEIASELGVHITTVRKRFKKKLAST